MRFNNLFIITSIILLSLFAGCGEKGAGNSDYDDVDVTELKAYENFVQNEDLLLGLTLGLKYDEESRHLFIHDLSTGVFETDDSSNVINVFGKRGPGPGEVAGVEDFFMIGEHFYNIDAGQNFINKYDLRDGKYISTLNYEDLIPEKTRPKLPFTDVNNIPFITLNETILLPSQANGEYLYQLINWEGEKLADIGEIPEGYTAEEDIEETRLALENKQVPARDSILPFPVHDRSNPEEIFIVYSAIPRIAKYSLSGQKLWERDIPLTSEVDSLMIDLSNIVEENPGRPSLFFPVRKYITGKSSTDGDLYLITYLNLQQPKEFHRPMWMHQFDSQGRLIHRYKIVSDESFSNIVGIDTDRRKLFAVVLQGIDIKTYEF